MKKSLLPVILMFGLSLSVSAINLKSTGGRYSINLADDGMSMSVVCPGNGSDTNLYSIYDISNLGIGVDGADNSGLNFLGCSCPVTVKDDYTMVGGKKNHYTNEANEYVLCYADANGHPQKIKLRAYDDGVAFQYIVSDLNGSKITDDFTTYRMYEGHDRWIQKYNDVYEDFFPKTKYGNPTHIKNNGLWGYPVLLQSLNDFYSLFTEAGIDKCHSASYLKSLPKKNTDIYTDYKVTMAENDKTFDGEWTSPWRVVIMGDLPQIVESSLVTDVCPETEYADTSWIKPGSVSWVYWAYNHGSNDYQIVKKYIDMAAELKLPYVLIDAEWDEMGNGGDINNALAYAKDKGVKVLIWYNSSTAWVNNGAPGPFYRLNKPEDREKEYQWLEDNGVAGVKIDFFSGDTQPTMEYCIDLLKDAARHHLMVNFHGATIPRGWQRTYPNLMSVEAVYGAEWYNNTPKLTNKAAAHNATLPFTRNIIGPMDYTPCTFSDSQHPHITTNAHELALPVLFESALLHWADKPESYLPQPEDVRDFISTLPTVWDETKLISGYPGDHVVMARRKGDTWWIAGINGTDEDKTISIDLSALNIDGKNECLLFEDTEECGNTWAISRPKGFNKKEISLKPRGGFVAVVK